MALAPRPHSLQASKGPSDGSTTAGQNAVKQRRRDAGLDPMKGNPSVVKYPSLPWEDVEDVATHICDIAGSISHSQVGSTGNVVTSLNCPTSYAHAMLEAHLASRDGLVYIRVFKVGREKFIEKMQRDAEAAALLESQLEAIKFGTQETMFDA